MHCTRHVRRAARTVNGRALTDARGRSSPQASRRRRPRGDCMSIVAGKSRNTPMRSVISEYRPPTCRLPGEGAAGVGSGNCGTRAGACIRRPYAAARAPAPAPPRRSSGRPGAAAASGTSPAPPEPRATTGSAQPRRGSRRPAGLGSGKSGTRMHSENASGPDPRAAVRAPVATVAPVLDPARATMLAAATPAPAAGATEPAAPAQPFLRDRRFRDGCAPRLFAGSSPWLLTCSRGWTQR
jgi:hypothetical protein